MGTLNVDTVPIKKLSLSNPKLSFGGSTNTIFMHLLNIAIALGLQSQNTCETMSVGRYKTMCGFNAWYLPESRQGWLKRG